MIIQSQRVWINETLVPAQIEYNEKEIVAIRAYNTAKPDKDYGDLMILPGLIDIHTHGYQGFNSNYATSDGLQRWTEYLPTEGVTSFLPTTSTALQQDIFASMAIIKDHQKENNGARILGIHVEGPFISDVFKGAHNQDWILEQTVDNFQPFEQVADGMIKLITLAPEKDLDHALLTYCIQQGIVVSIGHSGATMEECRLAKQHGATSFTHTCNAMLGLHHREPGTVGAALRMDDMYAEVIADGVHVHFDVVNILGQRKGKDRLILVTDAVAIKGLKPGIYETKDRWVEIGNDGCGRLKDGKLAGSSNKMNVMMRNLVTHCDLPLVTAINAATCNPARMLGFERRGSIKEGFVSDMVIMDEDFNVLQTYIGGSAMLSNGMEVLV